MYLLSALVEGSIVVSSVSIDVSSVSIDVSGIPIDVSKNPHHLIKPDSK
jgi:hypothetical protein